jgi:hypothetical protein
MAIQHRNNHSNKMYEEEASRDTDSLLRHDSKRSKTLSWNEIPTWMQDNIYITAGYRHPSNSYWECIKSLGYLHNESGKTKDIVACQNNNENDSEYLEPLVNVYSVCWIGCSFSIRSTFWIQFDNL